MKKISKNKSLIKKDDFITLLKIALKDRVLMLDCGHRFCMHHLSNTFVLTADGEILCHNCYN